MALIQSLFVSRVKLAKEIDSTKTEIAMALRLFLFRIIFNLKFLVNF